MAKKKRIKLNDQQLMLMADNVSDIYRQLCNDLFDNVVERLHDRGTYYLDQQPYLWQLEKMADVGMLNDHNIKLIAEYSGIAEKQIRYIIENEGYQVYKDTHAQLNSNAYDYKVMKDLISYSNQAVNDVHNLINTTLPKSVQATYKDIIETTVAKVITGMATPQKALDETIMKFQERGFYGYTDRAGRRQRADAYARTVIKTTARRTFNEMRMRPAQELGIDTFYYSIKAAAREMCAPLQNQIVTTGQARTEEGIKIFALDDYGYGKPGGCQGINCGHTMTPFIPGVNYMPDIDDDLKNLTPEQAIENANAQSKQRAIERSIRQSKEMLHVAEKLGNQELIDKYKSKVRIQQGAMRDYLKQHPFLHRDYAREKYYHNDDAVKKLYKTIDKRSKKEYYEILQNLGNKAPKSYSDFQGLSRSEKESLRQDNKVAAYVWSSTKEKLTDKQKQQAVDAYYNFKEHGVKFGGHAISQYMARMRRPNGQIMYNFDSILAVASLPLNYQSDYKGRKAKYYNRLLLIYENNSDEIVTFMKTSKPAKSLTEIKE
ncbi:phage minor capsid protein [Streptococcus vestibularis]|uniref:phage minor capsid protein n=1 Tax=Streptococcus vestibularis TaxID=1343 RepID=UPI002000A613|nr:phage minor capsid protein [Streptococcus vestibularis]MDU1714190.1 phage minor capsid protein [Streptococcus vestibularis]MDU1829710.1 phage minor capsid protein [Streptococcus vestibularis]DAT88909.1 MAG TPA: minor capsid protein [Caudoviricetes sp.]